mgnify:CR=1 FL=1
MNGTVNKVILIGNLGKDPEIRRLENGAIVASFSIATSESFTDKNVLGSKKKFSFMLFDQLHSKTFVFNCISTDAISCCLFSIVFNSIMIFFFPSFKAKFIAAKMRQFWFI